MWPSVDKVYSSCSVLFYGGNTEKQVARWLSSSLATWKYYVEFLIFENFESQSWQDCGLFQFILVYFLSISFLAFPLLLYVGRIKYK